MLRQDNPLLSCEFYQALLDNLFEALYVVDQHGSIIYWNKGCERLTGYTAQEMVGQPYRHTAIAYQKGMNPDQAKQRPGIVRVLETQVPEKWKGSIQRKDGQTIQVKSHITPIILDKGQIAGAVEILRNITSLRDHRIFQSRSRTLGSLSATLFHHHGRH